MRHLQVSFFIARFRSHAFYSLNQKVSSRIVSGPFSFSRKSVGIYRKVIGMSVHKLVCKKKIKVHGKSGCEGKRRFRSLEHAKEMLTTIRFRSELFSRTQGMESRFPIRAYECQNCKGFHLTSSPLLNNLAPIEMAS